MLVNLAEHDSIANRFVAELRNVEWQKDRMRFRRNLERLGEVFAYEISRTLEYEPYEIETPLGVANTSLPAQRVVVATILRAGLPLQQGLLNFFDAAEGAFVAAYRLHHKDGTFEIRVDYVTAPDLTDCVLLLTDPMLATGASINVALQELGRYGRPAATHVVSAIASSAGVDAVRRLHPQARLWLGAVDEELTAKGYIVPGLGDAGDLAYGEKGSQ